MSTLTYFVARSNLVICLFVLSTVSSMLSGVQIRSLGLNTLGTTLSPASSQSVHVVRPLLPGYNQYKAGGKCDLFKATNKR